MLIWVIALHCEAKPVIDYYRLKKSARHHAFDLFHNDNMQCVISGMGKNNAAAATAWVAGLNHVTDSPCWINLGIAGGGGRVIGDIYALDRITDAQTKRSYYPIINFDSKLMTTSCVTLDKPGNDYHPRHLFDMEASAYFATAIRFADAEFVQSLKVVSDNEDNPPVIDKAQISELINAKMASIDSLVLNLIKLKA